MYAWSRCDTESFDIEAWLPDCLDFCMLMMSSPLVRGVLPAELATFFAVLNHGWLAPYCSL